jgi:hypothetical protein
MKNTPRPFGPPLSRGEFKIQYYVLSTRFRVLPGNPLSRGEPHPSYRWRRRGVSAWNLIKDWIICYLIFDIQKLISLVH